MVCFIFALQGLEGETGQSGLPVDVRDRGRPSAQFARESSPWRCTIKLVFFFISTSSSVVASKNN